MEVSWSIEQCHTASVHAFNGTIDLLSGDRNVENIVIPPPRLTGSTFDPK